MIMHENENIKKSDISYFSFAGTSHKDLLFGTFGPTYLQIGLWKMVIGGVVALKAWFSAHTSCLRSIIYLVIFPTFKCF